MNETGRGLYTELGIRLISTPTVAQIQSLPNDPRLKYFTTLGDQAEFIPGEVDVSLKEAMIQNDSPYFLKMQLPESPEERNKAIVKAYVLDYPIY